MILAIAFEELEDTWWGTQALLAMQGRVSFEDQAEKKRKNDFT